MMSVTNIRSIFLKELRSYFNSPVAYIVMVVFLAMLGWFFTNNLFLANLSTMRVVFNMTPFLLLFFAPAITMRLISEEKKSGTLELLLTKPVQEYEIVTGKFFAAWSLFLLSLAPTFAYYLTVALLGSLDIGPVIGGYLGLFFVGAVFIAVSVFGSSLSENQVVAFIVSFLIVFVLFILDKVLFYMPAAIASILEYLSIEYHFSNIERGVIDTRDIIYYVSMIIVALSLGTIMVQKRRW